MGCETIRTLGGMGPSPLLRQVALLPPSDDAGGVQDERDLPQRLPDPLGGDDRRVRNLSPVTGLVGAGGASRGRAELEGGHVYLSFGDGHPFEG